MRYYQETMIEQLFEAFLKEKAHALDDVLKDYLYPSTHPDMDRYLYDPLSSYSSNAGKRHRPLICLLACKAVGGNPEDAKRSAVAIEHFHTAALIHDDIADESELRRGEPCMHIKEGEGLAINAGDLALSLVTGSVIHDPRLNDQVKLRVLRELVDMTTRTIEGQALDIGWARDNRFDITVDDYLVMAAHKTAYYSGGVPLAVGAIIGGGTDEQVETLRKYGMSTGLAFQIQDDLLNVAGDPDVVGKDFRSDITEGKRTLLAVYTLNHLEEDDKNEFFTLLSSKTTDPDDLQRAVDFMEKAGAIEYVRDYATRLAFEHVDAVKEVIPASLARKQLLAMADFFVNRLK